MTRSVSCRVCDFLEKYKVTWLSVPFWCMAAVFLLFSPLIWPLVLLWPVLALLAFVEAVRYSVCSACKVEFKAPSGAS